MPLLRVVVAPPRFRQQHSFADTSRGRTRPRSGSQTFPGCRSMRSGPPQLVVASSRVIRCALTSAIVGALLSAMLATPAGAQRATATRPARAGTRTLSIPRLDRVAPNDNLTAAGKMSGSVLTVRLVVRLAEWHPDGPSAPGVAVPAFASEGGVPQIPGPLVRIREGTSVVAVVRNALVADTLRVYGLHARPTTTVNDTTALVLAPGETKTVQFTLRALGTYYYWATTTNRALSFRTGLDGQLTGAIVVDAADASPPRDRIFVIGSWADTVARSFLPRHRVLGVVNGRSWPATERITATAGDSLHWRVINASGDLHPMHLHGFYFRVTARGDGTTDTLFAADRAPLEVTESATMGATYAMTWVPERTGNWLFHCHVPEHFGPRSPLGLPPDSSTTAGHNAHVSHAEGGMSGLVLGVTVRPRSGNTVAAIVPRDDGRRHVRLLVRENVGSTTVRPSFSYALHEGGPEPQPFKLSTASPPLVLTRGVPVRITVVNRLSEPTAVHWHGIELESFYDGVPGFSGAAKRLSPLIAPRDSFDVYITPPRAGTFIYHTHADEDRQQGAGLAGALVVVHPDSAFDLARDHVLLITSPFDFNDASRYLLFNGKETPDVITLRAGTASRVRVINMTTRRSGPRLRLFTGDSLLPWRALAKDGADIPPALRARRAVPQLVSIGETLDLEIAPSDTSDLRIEVRVGPQPNATLLGTQRFRVRTVP